MRVHALLDRLDLNRESVLVIVGDTLVPGRRAARRRATPSRSAPSSRGVRREVHGLQGAGRHRHPAPQRQLLRGALPAAVPRPGGQGHQGLRHAPARRARAGRGVRGQGLARRLGHPARARLPGRRPLPRASASATTATRPARWRAAFASERGLHLLEVDLPTDHGFDIPSGAKAAGGCPARPAGCRSGTCSTRRRARAATTSSSPATTSTTRPRCCSATSCTGRPTTSAGSSRCCPARNGFPAKVKPLVRLGEREMAAYCVLRGIDYIVEECPMADGQQAPRVQGGAQRRRGDVARHQARLLLRVPRPGVGAVHARGRGGAGAAASVRDAAARPPRRRCARSAASSSARHRRCRWSWAGRSPRDPRLRRGRAGAPHRHEEAPLPPHARRRARSSTPTPASSATTPSSARPRAPRSGRATG